MCSIHISFFHVILIQQMAANWQKKDWKVVLDGFSSGEEEDAHDCANYQSVLKNAHRVSELLHGILPGLDPSQMRTPPIGMNNADFMRAGLASTMRASLPHASAAPSAREASPANETPKSKESSPEEGVLV